MKTKSKAKLENHNYTALIKQSVAEAAQMRLGQIVPSRETVLIEQLPEKSQKPKHRKRLTSQELQAWFRHVDSLPVPEDAQPIDVVNAVRGRFILLNQVQESPSETGEMTSFQENRNTA